MTDNTIKPHNPYRNRLLIFLVILESLKRSGPTLQTRWMFLSGMPTNEFNKKIEYLRKIGCVTAREERSSDFSGAIVRTKWMITDKGIVLLEKIQNLNAFFPLNVFDFGIGYYSRSRKNNNKNKNKINENKE